MSNDESLKQFQALQVTQEQIVTYSQQPSFDELIRGFYVRLENSSSTSLVGLIEEVRIGRAYPLPHTKHCTKHILVGQPPLPKKTYRITDISNEIFTREDMQQWEASMAILQLTQGHRLDAHEAERRRSEMSAAAATSPQAHGEKPLIEAKRALTPPVEKLRERSPSVGSGSEATSEGRMRSSPLSHVAMFERRFHEDESSSHGPSATGKKSAASSLSRFLPAPAATPPEIVKASQTDAYRKELELAHSHTHRKVSQLAQTFEGSPAPLPDRSRRATVIGIQPITSLSALEAMGPDFDLDAPLGPTPTPPAPTKIVPTLALPESPPPSQALPPSEPGKALSVDDISSSIPRAPSPSKPASTENVSPAKRRRRPRPAQDPGLVVPLSPHRATRSRGSLDLDLSGLAPREPITRESLRLDPIVMRSAQPKKKRNTKKKRARRLKESPLERADAAAVLDALGLTEPDDDDSFLSDSLSPETRSLQGSSEQVHHSATSSEETLGQVPVAPLPKNVHALASQQWSGHKRHISSEDVGGVGDPIQRDPLPSPRSAHLDMHHVLSRIIIPVSSMDPEWESKKIRHFEKQARHHAKERDVYESEREASQLKMQQETDALLSALDAQHAQERTATSRKIQTDQTALTQVITGEKRQLTRTLARAKEEAGDKLWDDHARDAQRQVEEFEKQVAQLRRVNDASEMMLLAHLRQAHEAQMKRKTREKDLSQLQLVHRHEQSKLKRVQEQERKHVEMQQHLARETLLLQLSLAQRQTRQKRWVVLDDLRSRENTQRQLQEKRQQMELRHETSAQEMALKLLRKQHSLEREGLTREQQHQQKQGHSVLQKQKKALKAQLLAHTKKLQRDKTLTKDAIKEQVEAMRSQMDSQLTQLEEELLQTAPPDQRLTIETRHIAQLHDFDRERTRRRDVLLLGHQQQKLELQARLEEERRQWESRMKASMDAFQQEEREMKEAFTEAHDHCLWDIQQRHWQASSTLQATHHEEQQQFMKAAAAVHTARRADPLAQHLLAPPRSDAPTDTDAARSAAAEEERQRQTEEAARQAEEEERLQRELQRQLEEQQEAEKRQLEAEREAEQERLRAQLEEEKKEVMETQTQEDENSLRLEYIKKIAWETGLSEELIAAQLDRIGMPSFMF